WEERLGKPYVYILINPSGEITGSTEISFTPPSGAEGRWTMSRKDGVRGKALLLIDVRLSQMFRRGAREAIWHGSDASAFHDAYVSSRQKAGVLASLYPAKVVKIEGKEPRRSFSSSMGGYKVALLADSLDPKFDYLRKSLGSVRQAGPEVRSEVRKAPERVKITPNTFVDVKTLRVSSRLKVSEEERLEAIRLMTRLLDGYFRIRGNLWPSKTEEERTEMLSLHLNDPLQIRFVNLGRYGVRFPEVRIIIDSEESLSYVYHIPSEKKWIKGGLEDRIANLIVLLYGDEVERLRFGNLASHVMGSSYWEEWRGRDAAVDSAYQDYHERIHPLMTKVVEAAVRHAVPIHGEIGILDLLGGDGHFLLGVMGNLEANGLEGVQAALMDKDAGSVKAATKLLSKYRNVKVYPATDIRAIKDFDAVLGKKYPIVTAVGGFNEQVLTLAEAKRLMKKVYDYLPQNGLLIMTGRSRPLLDADYLRDQVGFEILNTYVPSLNVPLYVLKKPSRRMAVEKSGPAVHRSEVRNKKQDNAKSDVASFVAPHLPSISKVKAVKPWQILKLQQDVTIVLEQSKIDALSPEMFRELLELVGVNNTKLHLVIPDVLDGKYSDRVAELKSVGLVYYGLPELVTVTKGDSHQRVPVVGFSDMEKDTLEAFQKRLDPKLAGWMKNSAFGLNQPGAFGVGILYAIKDMGSATTPPAVSALKSSKFLKPTP
ncbi:MAG: hypothetical protein HY767_01880, partial [Candidatus Omnitrophica bacterium]|nr:hypothetical protein [Candidatus Omnitrophota bacterium]